MDYMTKWARVRVKLGDPKCTLYYALSAFAEEWPFLEAPFKALGLVKDTEPDPENTPFANFAKAIDRYLALEAREGEYIVMGDMAPTFPEFLESIGRAMATDLCMEKAIINYASPYNKVSGIRRPYRLTRVLQQAGSYLMTNAEWLGEPIGRAGEKLPMWDPNDWGTGSNPWSMP